MSFDQSEVKNIVTALRRKGEEYFARSGNAVSSDTSELEVYARSESWSPNAVADWETIFSSPVSTNALLPALIRLGELRHPNNTSTRVPALISSTTALALAICSPFQALRDDAAIAQQLVTRLALSIRPGGFEVYLVDLAGHGQLFGAVAGLPGFILKRVVTGDSELDSLLKELAAEALDRTMLIARQGKKDFADLVTAQVDDSLPYKLLWISGFPSGLTEEQVGSIFSLARSSISTGIGILLLWNSDIAANSQAELNEWKGRRALVSLGRAGAGTGAEQLRWGGLLFTPDIPVQFPADFAESLDDRQPIVKKPLLSELLSSAPERQTIDDRIDVPFGRLFASSRLAILSFGTNDTNSGKHVLILGAPGSGKTVLLHSVIMSAAWRYSPDDLRLILLDFGGNNFREYSELPHAYVVGGTTDPEFGESVLYALRREMDVRSNTFGKHGQVRNIVEYRQVTDAPRMPSILVVADEFQILANSQTQVFNDLIARGRQYGIFVILATQTLSNGRLSDAALNNIASGILMKNQARIDQVTILGNDPALNSLTDLQAGQGMLVLDRNAPKPQKFVAAWSSANEVKAAIQRLKEVYPEERARIVCDSSINATWKANSALRHGVSSKVIYLGEPLVYWPGHVSLKQGSASVLIEGSDTETAMVLAATIVKQWPRTSPDAKVVVVSGGGVDRDRWNVLARDGSLQSWLSIGSQDSVFGMLDQTSAGLLVLFSVESIPREALRGFSALLQQGWFLLVHGGSNGQVQQVTEIAADPSKWKNRIHLMGHNNRSLLTSDGAVRNPAQGQAIYSGEANSPIKFRPYVDIETFMPYP